MKGCLIGIDGGAPAARLEIARRAAQRLPSSELTSAALRSLRDAAASLELEVIVDAKHLGRFQEAMLRLAHANALVDYSGPGRTVPIIHTERRPGPDPDAWAAVLKALGDRSAILCGRYPESTESLVLHFHVGQVTHYSLAVRPADVEPGAVARLACAVVGVAARPRSSRFRFAWRLEPGR